MSNASTPIFPMWLNRWPAMRKIVLVTMIVVVALEVAYALLTLSLDPLPKALDDGLKLATVVPSLLLFAPAGFCLWRWQVRRWCVRPGLQGARRIMLTGALLLLLAFEICFFIQVEPRGWYPHKYTWPPLLAGPLVAALAILVLKAEPNKKALSARWLMLLAFGFLVASLLVDVLHFSGTWLMNTPVLGNFLSSCFLWVYLPLSALGGNSGNESFQWTASCFLGAILAVIAIWDLRMKRVHWTTAGATVATGATLIGFISNWGYFLID